MTKKPVPPKIKRALKKAIKTIGSQRKLAAACKEYLPPDKQIAQSAISGWLHGYAKVAPWHATAIEKATNGEVKRWELRPDVYEEE